MPHTPRILERLREALAIADLAEDHLVAAYIVQPIELLEARLDEPPEPDPGP